MSTQRLGDWWMVIPGKPFMWTDSNGKRRITPRDKVPSAVIAKARLKATVRSDRIACGDGWWILVCASWRRWVYEIRGGFAHVVKVPSKSIYRWKPRR